ncbi:hypothetical protein Glove_142g3 [Diversispora epigaea]|uniref:Uncharacterized protein n=1 Tax=Diversispora epigaea TaxID=1348612 RepID=A0A397J476_9GLOM|nr:hypothetical protein Glove_142g8 [Diversispora epigaea]RHZ79680.1 hypothetical protein Glove_142g3 [Diversispora epigaea]
MPRIRKSLRLAKIDPTLGVISLLEDKIAYLERKSKRNELLVDEGRKEIIKILNNLNLFEDARKKAIEYLRNDSIFAKTWPFSIVYNTVKSYPNNYSPTLNELFRFEVKVKVLELRIKDLENALQIALNENNNNK